MPFSWWGHKQDSRRGGVNRTVTHLAFDGFGSQMFAVFSCMLVSRLSNGAVRYVAPADMERRSFAVKSHRSSLYFSRAYSAVHVGWPRFVAERDSMEFHRRQVKDCHAEVREMCVAAGERCAFEREKLVSEWRRAIFDALPIVAKIARVDVAVHVREGDLAFRRSRASSLLNLGLQHKTLTVDAASYGALYKLLRTSTTKPSLAVHLFTEQRGEGTGIVHQLPAGVVTVHAAGDPLVAWASLIRSHVLVMHDSTFSCIAALLADGLLVGKNGGYPACRGSESVLPPRLDCSVLNGSWWWSVGGSFNAGGSRHHRCSLHTLRTAMGGARGASSERRLDEYSAAPQSLEASGVGPAAMAEYLDLSEAYWGRNGGRPSECLAHARRMGLLPMPPPNRTAANFMTVGLEGAGHHLLEQLDRSLCGDDGKVCGHAWSFSYCGTCRDKPSIAWRRVASAKPYFPKLPAARDAHRYVVIVRSPVEAFISALRRFWRPSVAPHDTLTRELSVFESSMRAMNDAVSQLPCDGSTLFLAYELLTRFPEAHRAPLAAFLGVKPSDARLTHFLQGLSVRGGASPAGRNTETWKRNHSLEVAPIACDSTLANQLLMYHTSHVPAVLRAHGWPPDKGCNEKGVCLRQFQSALTLHLFSAKTRASAPSLLPVHPLSVCAEVDKVDHSSAPHDSDNGARSAISKVMSMAEYLTRGMGPMWTWTWMCSACGRGRK